MHQNLEFFSSEILKLRFVESENTDFKYGSVIFFIKDGCLDTNSFHSS